MILEGKYLFINSNNYKDVIKLLTKFGYVDGDADVKSFIETYRDENGYYLYCEGNRLVCCFAVKIHVDIIYKKEINLQVLLREHKLKRILK